MKYRKKFLCTAVTGGILTLYFFLHAWSNQEQLRELERPGYGEGDQEQSLQVQMEDGSYSIDLLLAELPLGEEEAQECLAAAAEGLEKLMLNGNEDLHQIQTDLYLPSEIPQTQVTVQWYLDSWELIAPDGTVYSERVKEATTVRIQALLSLQGNTLTWEREARVCPPVSPDSGQKLRMLQRQVQEAQKKPDKKLILPETVNGEAVAWYRKRDDRWMLIGLWTVAALCAMAAGRHREEELRIRERERSLQLDYPDIVSRLSLYMSAGMSTRKAWEKIVDNYERREGKGTRAAYEEMCRTLREMQSGIPETAAYERYGMRCRLPSYLKLGTLLGQNLRKGNKDLSRLLEEESREAFEDRKALAKKLGEECESKLLLPMLLLLVTILIMVMYPAAVSFQI